MTPDEPSSPPSPNPIQTFIPVPTTVRFSTSSVIAILALVVTVVGGIVTWATREGVRNTQIEILQREVGDLKDEVKQMRMDVSSIRGDMNGVRGEILNWMATQDRRRGREVPDDYVAPRDRRNGG